MAEWTPAPCMWIVRKMRKFPFWILYEVIPFVMGQNEINMLKRVQVRARTCMLTVSPVRQNSSRVKRTDVQAPRILVMEL